MLASPRRLESQSALVGESNYLALSLRRVVDCGAIAQTGFGQAPAAPAAIAVRIDPPLLREKHYLDRDYKSLDQFDKNRFRKLEYVASATCAPL